MDIDLEMDDYDEDVPYTHYPDPDNVPQFNWPPALPPHDIAFGWDGDGYDDCPPSEEEDLPTVSRELLGLRDDTRFHPAPDDSEDLDFLNEDADSHEIDGDESLSDEQSVDVEPNLRRKARRVRGRNRGRALQPSSKRRRALKRGHRKPLEPTQNFKDLFAHASAAFVACNYDRAQGLVEQAIADNPEMFTARSLLAEILFARGDKFEASVTLFEAAHTRSRDPEIWMRLAQLLSETPDDGRKSILPDTIYCYSRILSFRSDHFEARMSRAREFRDKGQNTKALADYLKLSRSGLQHDKTILRHIAETYMELGDAGKAIKMYDEAIAHFKSLGASCSEDLGWSDLNIFAELFIQANEPEEGLMKLKSVARWIAGREDETFWDEYTEDDREFDKPDNPRRLQVPQLTNMMYPTSSYGDELPLELRVKLGLFRLAQGPDHFNEALQHFSWLQPESESTEAPLYIFPDLFREVAEALQTADEYREALRFYEPMRRVQISGDMQLIKNMATCFRECNLLDQAEAYYLMATKEEEDNLECLRDLAKMFHDTGHLERAQPYLQRFQSAKRESLNKLLMQNDSSAMPVVSVEGDDPFDLPTALLKSGPGRHTAESDSVSQESLRQHVSEMEALTGRIRAGDSDAKQAWMSLAHELITIFVNVRRFYPDRRYRKYFAFSREARTKVTRTRSGNGALDLSQESGDTVPIEAPSGYREITFGEWLDIFLKYAMHLSEQGKPKNVPYSVLKSAMNANVFFHNKDHVFAIQIVWSLCALRVNDSRTVCTIARALMLQYQFITDSYRYFAVLNRICGRPNFWYNSGSSQKFVLRQIKAVDFSLRGEKTVLPAYREKAAFYNKDEKGNPIKAEGMDIELLLLYGQLLCAGGGYREAMNYFYRAHALDPDHPLILLSLALGYIHHSLKRQAANRHTLIAQGFTFLHAYRAARADTPTATDAEKQEVEFNFGRAYMMLGLSHLAVPCFEKVLKMENDRRERTVGESNGPETNIEGENAPSHKGGENYALEAAYHLQGIWALSGQTEAALEITEKWLVL